MDTSITNTDESYWKAKYLEAQKELDNLIKWDLEVVKPAKAKLDNRIAESEACISFAKLIDWNMMGTKVLQENNIDYFMFNQPLARVGGDLFVIKKIEDRIFIFISDPLGHGLSSQVYNTLTINMINDVMYGEDTNYNLIEILESINQRYTDLINQSRENDNCLIYELGLLIIDLKQETVAYSGNGYCYIKTTNEWINLKGSRLRMGQFPKSDRGNRNLNTYSLNDIDCIYLSTDGYTDQFGGDRGTKMLKRRYLDLLKKIYTFSMKEQKNEIKMFLDNWMNYSEHEVYEQVDDILLLGIKINKPLTKAKKALR